MLNKFEKDILKIGFVLRICIWIVSYFSDKFIPDHDRSTDLMLTTPSNPDLTLISSLLKCFVRWDALFYVTNAESGYEYLKNHAFFPLYPRLIKVLRDVIFTPTKILSGLDALILTGVLFNLIIHLANLIIFYR